MTKIDQPLQGSFAAVHYQAFHSLEFLINIQSNFNEVIMLSFYGHIQSAIDRTKY
jgi:hypothetical protein